MKHLLIIICALPFLLAVDLPQELRCNGTEPFWGVSVTKQVSVFDEFGEKTALEVKEAESYEGQSNGAGFVVRMVTLDKKKRNVTLFAIEANGCSDGMSDNAYEKFAVLDIAGDKTFYGCCNVKTKGPVRYEVIKVKTGDSLNVRRGPGIINPIIGKIAHNASGIERTQCLNGWCFVNYKPADGKTISGWVNQTYLKESKN